jgi:replicative DNA helicase
VLASQLRRPERDTVAEPNVTALKESGTIENRAQAIVLLWRGESDKHLVHAKLAKVKRVASGQKFDLVRNPSTGQLVEQAVEWDQ